MQISNETPHFNSLKKCTTQNWLVWKKKAVSLVIFNSLTNNAQCFYHIETS